MCVILAKSIHHLFIWNQNTDIRIPASKDGMAECGVISDINFQFNYNNVLYFNIQSLRRLLLSSVLEASSAKQFGARSDSALHSLPIY